MCEFMNSAPQEYFSRRIMFGPHLAEMPPKRKREEEESEHDMQANADEAASAEADKVGDVDVDPDHEPYTLVTCGSHLGEISEAGRECQ